MTYSLLLGFAIRITFTISHKKMPLIPEGIFFFFHFCGSLPNSIHARGNKRCTVRMNK